MDGVSGNPYFVMDLVLNERGEMQLLSDVEPGTVDEETVGKWYDDLREGLAYIHANGVIHRDLKLQNVLIGPDGHAVLTDFGISKIFDAKGDGVQIVDTVRTLVKVREGRSLVMGSLGYMAPELEMGVAASPQSDWYALGVIVYRLLTGTWCDARTDVVGTLETYDPVWKRVIPKLLHSNPQGRECLSYAEEKRVDREKQEFELEERWLKEKGRGHRARHVARYVAVAALALGVFIAFVWRGRSVERTVFMTGLRDSAELVDKAAAKLDTWIMNEEFDAFDISEDRKPTKSAEKKPKGKTDNLFDDFDGFGGTKSQKRDVAIADSVKILLEQASVKLHRMLRK